MSKIREFVTDCQNCVIFAVTLAIDVWKYTREEKKNEKLCLQM
jgi:hypothetical protein